MAAFDHRPFCRAVCLRYPIASLEADVGLADIVQKGQSRQAGYINAGQWPTGRNCGCTSNTMKIEQDLKHRGHIGHVVQQGVNLHAAVERAP